MMRCGAHAWLKTNPKSNLRETISEVPQEPNDRSHPQEIASCFLHCRYMNTCSLYCALIRLAGHQKALLCIGCAVDAIRECTSPPPPCQCFAKNPKKRVGSWVLGAVRLRIKGPSPLPWRPRRTAASACLQACSASACSAKQTCGTSSD